MADWREEPAPEADEPAGEPQEKERPADAGDPGDWGNAGRWGVFGNRPDFHRDENRRENLA